MEESVSSLNYIFLMSCGQINFVFSYQYRSKVYTHRLIQFIPFLRCNVCFVKRYLTKRKFQHLADSPKQSDLQLQPLEHHLWALEGLKRPGSGNLVVV